VGVLKLWMILGELKSVLSPTAKDVGIKDMRVKSQGLGSLGYLGRVILYLLFSYLKGP
jgi:hypothetical protein